MPLGNFMKLGLASPDRFPISQPYPVHMERIDVFTHFVTLQQCSKMD